ncbi:site-specific recombinase, phage integrase family [Bacteroides sp. 2_1_33B]|nr:site-specific recombinase, phage integrase family [Bacteroides sp. 2_1_33B]
MATVKVKYRPSVQEEKEGTIYYQIIHNRVIRQIRTDYRIFREEWDNGKHAVVITTGDREAFLRTVREGVARDLKRLNAIIGRLEGDGGNFTADDVVKKFQEPADEPCFFSFMEEVIARLKRLGKTRTSETYTAALNSFMRFREGRDILPDEIDSDLIEEYEVYLKGCGVSLNTVSFYNRILRATYNRAVEKGLTPQRHPFRNVYTGMEKTVKRAIPFEAVRRIKELDLSLKPLPDFARDMFLFSFYTRGMSFVDMAYLRKSDLKNGMLSYRRKKTGQQLHIRWERCMREIVEKHPNTTTEYLLPIITDPTVSDRKQYENALHLVNRKLKKVAEMVGLSVPLTMYVSRHSWASTAKRKNIPLSVISEGMGHDSETTTQIYLASLDTSVIDEANKLILKDL